MTVKLLCLCLLLALLCPSQAKNQKCRKFASKCDECIQSGPECAWCAAPDSYVRCNTLKALRRGGCSDDYIYNPQGRLIIARNVPSNHPISGEVVLVEPQEFHLHLRPGVSQSFSLAITVPTDQPTTELTMDTSPLPVGLNITFRSTGNRNPFVVQVNIEAAKCPGVGDDSNQNRTEPWSVYITPRGVPQSVKLEITLECQCECYEDYSRQLCHLLDDSFLRTEHNCRPGPNAPLCSGRGECEEGTCICERRENPGEVYTGKYCECSNFDCPYHNNRICGGHGRCECGKCVCDHVWIGEDCSCSLETASCMAKNQALCNHRGVCDCGKCKCDPPYAGPTCEDCPTCQGK